MKNHTKTPAARGVVCLLGIVVLFGWAVPRTSAEEATFRRLPVQRVSRQDGGRLDRPDGRRRLGRRRPSSSYKGKIMPEDKVPKWKPGDDQPASARTTSTSR